MDLLEKSRNTLELPAVLEMLAGEAVSEPAKAEALALVPSVHRAEVERLLAETSDAKDMMVYKGSPSLSGLRDVRGSLARADMGGVLNTRELLEIAGVLQSARAVRSYGMSAEKETCIDHLFKMLQTNRFLEDKIVNSIPGEDEIADSASSELSDIRRKMRAAAARVRDSLQKIISAPSMAKFLQDPIITTRSDRYVVPVKAECKGSVPGLVHDVSASGATLFVEPMAAVKANNEIRELESEGKSGDRAHSRGAFRRVRRAPRGYRRRLLRARAARRHLRAGKAQLQAECRRAGALRARRPAAPGAPSAAR